VYSKGTTEDLVEFTFHLETMFTMSDNNRNSYKY